MVSHAGTHGGKHVYFSHSKCDSLFSLFLAWGGWSPRCSGASLWGFWRSLPGWTDLWFPCPGIPKVYCHWVCHDLHVAVYSGVLGWWALYWAWIQWELLRDINSYGWYPSYWAKHSTYLCYAPYMECMSVCLFTCTGITQYRRCKLNVSLLPECNSTTAIADDKQSVGQFSLVSSPVVYTWWMYQDIVL